MSFWRRARYAAGVLAVIGCVGVAATVVGVEKSCVSHQPTPAVRSDFAITDAGYARFQGDSFLTFPEWYIVHAYNDLAGVTAQLSRIHDLGFDVVYLLPVTPIGQAIDSHPSYGSPYCVHDYAAIAPALVPPKRSMTTPA